MGVITQKYIFDRKCMCVTLVWTNQNWL